jgi:DNA-binding Lrp family transcriptional regulator
MIQLDPKVKTLVRDNAGLRLAVLVILWAAAAPATVQDIADVINCSRKSIGEVLPRMEQDGYTARLGAGRHPRWTLTDKAQQLELPGLSSYVNSSVSNGRNFLLASSSSDLDLSLSSLDQIESEEEEEQQREESSPQERAALADDYRLTGDYRTTVLADAWITRRRFEAWYTHAEANSKRNPAAYAVTCCQNHDEPPAEESSGQQFQRDIERYRRRQGKRTDADIDASWDRALNERKPIGQPQEK